MSRESGLIHGGGSRSFRLTGPLFGGNNHSKRRGKGITGLSLDHGRHKAPYPTSSYTGRSEAFTGCKLKFHRSTTYRTGQRSFEIGFACTSLLVNLICNVSVTRSIMRRRSWNEEKVRKTRIEALRDCLDRGWRSLGQGAPRLVLLRYVSSSHTL